MFVPTIFAREGFSVPGTEALYGKPLVKLELLGIDVSINRTVIFLLAATAITIALFHAAFRKPQVVPKGLQNVMESLVEFMKNQVVLPVMGPKGLPYLPYLTLLFTFVFACNIFGVIPGVNFPVNSRIGIPLVLAIGTWLVFIGAGIKNQGVGGYFKSALMPAGVPKPILIFLVPIEFLSTFILRPLTLTVRLTINMIVGHLMLVVLFLGTAYLLERPLTLGFGIGTAIAGTAFLGFEIFVAALQAFIFAILTAVYISGSIEPHH